MTEQILLRAGKLFDKTGREIMAGDILKVFHFIGARRKRHFIYKQAKAIVMSANGNPCWEISHLSSLNGETYKKSADGRVLDSYEIVQGYGPDGVSFEDRPREAKQ